MPGSPLQNVTLNFRFVFRDTTKIKRSWSSVSSSNNLKNENERRQQIMGKGLPKQKAIEGVKQVLLVASGKGGVGKSTTSVNLATALKIVEPNKAVGLLDADIFGPTIPLMMNLHQTPLLNDNNLMEPLVNYGVKCMSMGFLVDEKSPVIWRGLMVMSALDKLLRQVAWNPLDYLIVDTPPGTGDTLLSLIQNIPISGVVIVTTPQQAALDVARRGAKMFQKMKVPIAGLVENMTSLTCPNCSEQVSLFGEGGTLLSKELGIPILKKFPLDRNTTESGDLGKPIVLAHPNSTQATLYKELAQNILVFLQKQINSS
ncbi:iron-sulfur protein NUBPL [Microplitis demolitor]|uniref:iron-sulfur protein NUBPL n=1 Tax=Microplitis demolitor TaxID=69319 RepID=UPI0004CD2E43|nr:iron-sulfur protein NUBPL [Microplitis demolitor]